MNIFKAAKLRYWLPLAIYSYFIFCFSSVPAAELPPIPFWDEVSHLAEYLLWGFLAIIALKNSVGFEKRRILIAAVLLGFSFAVFDEIHQLFIPGREFSYFDIFFDVVGLITGSAFIYDRNISA